MWGDSLCRKVGKIPKDCSCLLHEKKKPREGLCSFASGIIRVPLKCEGILEVSVGRVECGIVSYA